MADVEVKEIEGLKLYRNRLNDFKTGTTAVGALIDRQIRKIKGDLSDKRNTVRMNLRTVEENADKVIQRYEYALYRCPNARPYIGETDIECKEKIKDAEHLAERINDKIRQLETELENAGIHTKNFCLQVINMAEGCQSKLNQNIDRLEAYKQIQIKK